MPYFSSKVLCSFCLVFIGLDPVAAREISPEDSLKVAGIYQTTVKMIHSPRDLKIDSLLYHCRTGIRLAKTYNVPNFIPDFITNMAYGYKVTRQFDSAIVYVSEAYKEALKLNYVRGISRSGYTRAMIFFDRGDIKPSIEQLSENLQFARKHHLKRDLHVNYHLLSHITTFTNNPLITDYYSEKAFESLEDSTLLHAFRLQIQLKNAIIEGDKENEEKLYKAFRGVVLRNKEQPDMDEITFLVNIANTYLDSNNPRQALTIFEELAGINITGSGYPEKAFYAGLAAAYLSNNQLKKAEIFNSKANKDISLLYNYVEYRTILKTMAILQEKKGMMNDALKTWNKLQKLDDSLAHKRNEINYLLVTSLKNLESLENKFESVNQENVMQRQLLEKEKRQNILLLSLVLVLIIFSLVVYILFRKLKVRNQKILEQNEAISRQTRSLRESNLVKDKLFSLLSHELRSPVAELITILDVNEWKNKDNTLNPYFKSVNLKAKAIYNTLDNILTWSASQLKFKKTDVRTINIRETVHRALELNSSYIRQKNIRISNEVNDSLVDAHESYLMIIFRNVLNNATKFTLANGEIRLYSVEEGNYSGIVVQDSGKGMEPETLKSLFVSAQTSSEGTEGEKGSGVGLILCKDLMDKLQGKIEVSSVLNRGTSVRLLFKKAGYFMA